MHGATHEADRVKHPDDDARGQGKGPPLPADHEADAEVVSSPTDSLDRRAPSLATAYTVADLDAAERRELVSLARLPSWPVHPSEKATAGHGWGNELDKVLGGGVCPGYMLGVGASYAGAGKTAWVMQIAEGLALRTAEILATSEPGPLTPVLVLSEMSAEALTWRSLARWTGEDSRIFRAGKSAKAIVENDREGRDVVVDAFTSARRALTEGLYADARRYLRLLRTNATGAAAIEEASATVRDWRAHLTSEHGRDVWPIVVLDPIQRFQSYESSGEVEALNELVESLSEHALADGWVVFVTSDTNKPSATGQGKPPSPREEGSQAFRGSYKLLHLLDAALYLKSGLDDTGRMDAVIVKNRWGTAREHPSYRWDAKTGRFYAPERSKVRV